MSKLIKEAIADARAVREMAVKQAKSVLEEAFTPKVEKLVSQRLQTEMEDEEYDEMEEGIEYGTDDDHEEAEENSGLTEDADSSDIGTSDNKEPSAASSEESTEDIEGEIDVQSDHDTAEESELTEGEDFDEDDVDLEEIIRELEGESDEMDDMEIEEDDDMDADDEFGDEESGDEFGDDEDIEIDIDDDENGDEEIKVDENDDMDADDEFGDIDSEEEGDEELELEIDGDEDFGGEEDEDEEELNLESVINSTRMNSLRTENAKLKRKISEALKAIKIQKAQLNEVNLLNAKLLFVNKVFGQYSLDDASKVKIVENFDRAKTLREVKLIFATLMENMKADKRTSNKVQRLSEGASGIISSVKKNDSKIIDDNSDMKARVHKLIKYNKK